MLTYNCLVEKLNGSVNPSEFDKFGSFKMMVKPIDDANETNSSFRVAYATKSGNAEIIGSGTAYFTDASDEAKVRSQSAVKSGSIYEFPFRRISKEASEIEFDNKYDIYFVGTGQNGSRFVVDLDQLAYSPQIKFLEFNGAEVRGDIAAIANMSSLKNFIISYNKGTGLYGDTSVFALHSFDEITIINLTSSSKNIEGKLSDFRDLTSLVRLSITGTSIGGRIEDISTLTNLKEMNLNQHTTGDIVDFVIAQRTAGRETCEGISSLYLYACSNLKFDGRPIFDVIGTSNVTSTIKWTKTSITVDSQTVNR